MSVMFEEEVSKLRLRIVELQDQMSMAERDRSRLAQALNEEKQLVGDAEAIIVALREELADARGRAEAARRLSERLAGMEAAVSEADTRANRLGDDNERLRKELRLEKTEVGRLNAVFAAASSRLTLLEEQVGPLEALVAALRAKDKAERTILEQLGELKIGDSDD